MLRCLDSRAKTIAAEERGSLHRSRMTPDRVAMVVPAHHRDPATFLAFRCGRVAEARTACPNYHSPPVAEGVVTRGTRVDVRMGSSPDSRSMTRRRTVLSPGNDPCPEPCPELPKSHRTERTSEHLTERDITQTRCLRGTSNPRAEVRLLPGPFEMKRGYVTPARSFSSRGRTCATIARFFFRS